MLDISKYLPFTRQRAFARCALLRLAQRALDCKDYPAPRRAKLAQRFPELVSTMLGGLQEFVQHCQRGGIPKHQITSSRVLLHKSATNLDRTNARLLGDRPRLVFTSPPYPGVHVLYHRWQCFGRKETPAPYWIAQVPDGYGASFYTCGSRTPTGLRNYFTSITASFGAIHQVIARDALVVQLIGFADLDTQLPEYLTAMEEAGFTR